MKDFDNRLEELFLSYRQSQEGAELPYGHKERFLRKLAAPEKQKPEKAIRIAWVSLAAAACIVAAAIFIPKVSSGSLDRFEEECLAELQEMGNQLKTDSHLLPHGDKEDALYSISSIVDGEELMALQLPENMSKKEKQKIIREYYNQKMEGLKKIKTFIAMNEPEEE